ncbi:uncharacterized protein LOC106649869 [Trichogramma pretiosum]|uniref:uncharacterized protein LOC106649869 n=1 Tax=Trichogramma pretiosum TaxID=7493 RepID=UPI000C719EF9|nr:uncharacterized protein LOC106649869 [Trichogramma pretiosum]XP_023317538.1 uncharacterized protein LOC106649869 [Trichogramma pretiosum]XP_023317539.1 uncharacterized protein LOC106649869 [Trichogramma pretiosum]
MGRKSKRKHKTGQSFKSNNSKYNARIDDEIIEKSLAESKPLLITERLNISPYHAEEVDDEECELQLDFRPRPYFAPSLCYFCSKPCTAETSVPCDSCNMVVYCSLEHHQQNVKFHKQLCTVVTEICRRNHGLDLAKNLNADEYRSFRIELLHIVQTALGRRMELWEREILLYPKLCRACHASENLEQCDKCLMEFFCKDDPVHKKQHDLYCQEYKVFQTILRTQRDNGFVAPKIPDYIFEENHELPDSFDELIKQIFDIGCDYEKIDCTTYAALSQIASPALTAFYVLRKQLKLNLNRKILKIHVIGAELQFECANLAVWEKLFMHLMPGIKNLRLEFCGPEFYVPPDIANVLQKPKLCTSCRTKGRTIDIIFHCGKLYHQVENDKPDLICLFNPGLYRTTGFANQDTWPLTIEKFCNYGVPILITSYTEVELPRDLQRIRDIREAQVECEPRRNPFASLKPERNFVSDDVAPLIYKNYFLSVVKGINSNKTERRCANPANKV